MGNVPSQVATGIDSHCDQFLKDKNKFFAGYRVRRRFVRWKVLMWLYNFNPKKKIVDTKGKIKETTIACKL